MKIYKKNAVTLYYFCKQIHILLSFLKQAHWFIYNYSPNTEYLIETVIVFLLQRMIYYKKIYADRAKAIGRGLRTPNLIHELTRTAWEFSFLLSYSLVTSGISINLYAVPAVVPGGYDAFKVSSVITSPRPPRISTSQLLT
jgi:hypothetical protein